MLFVHAHRAERVGQHSVGPVDLGLGSVLGHADYGIEELVGLGFRQVVGQVGGCQQVIPAVQCCLVGGPASFELAPDDLCPPFGRQLPGKDRLVRPRRCL